jgi:hypothetical protein
MGTGAPGWGVLLNSAKSDVLAFTPRPAANAAERSPNSITDTTTKTAAAQVPLFALRAPDSVPGPAPHDQNNMA